MSLGVPGLPGAPLSHAAGSNWRATWLRDSDERMLSLFTGTDSWAPPPSSQQPPFCEILGLCCARLSPYRSLPLKHHDLSPVPTG